MRVRFNERSAIQLYLFSTLACVLLTMLTAWLTRGLFQPVGILVMWLCCCLQMALTALLVWLRTLRGLEWPCRHLSIEAPLLVSSAYHAHHGQFPLTMADTPRMTSGPSVLLLSTCAMLTLPEKRRTPAQQAVMDYLAPLKLDQNGFIRKHPKLGVRSDGRLDWLICQDGGGLRAYASGDALTVLDSCDFIWDGEPKPLTEQLRRSLASLWADEVLPPMGFAMAAQEGGQPVDGVFLGAVLMEHQLLPNARHEVDVLRRHGYEVSMQGLDEAALDVLSEALGCDPAPDEDWSDVLTLACTNSAAGSNIYLLPEGMPPTRTVSYLRTQTRRLLYQPIQAAVLLTMAALCCLAGGMGVMVMALVQLALLSMLAFGPVRPRPLPAVQPRRAAIGAAAAMLLVPAMCFAAAWFLRVTVGESAGACTLFLLPVAMFVSYQSARLSSTIKPTLALLSVSLFAVGFVAIGVLTGALLVSGAFALVAGTLTAFAVHALLQYADHR